MGSTTTFLQSVIKRVAYYKELGNRSFDQLQDADFHYRPNEESNSIAVIIQHMYGNMLSRWTDVLTTDGEKEWRNRDTEFEIKDSSKAALLDLWEKGWKCFLDALHSFTENDLEKTVHIRREPLILTDAIIRQLAHYPYHVGQIVYIARIIRSKDWVSLSIPKGGSEQFNERMK